MRTRSILLGGIAAVICARATTLQQLSMEEMIQQSTGIVRAKVTGSSSALRGKNIYTYYHLQILETAKPIAKPIATPAAVQRAEIDVAVPGGTANGIRQVAVGAPELTTGSQYVVFLWTSPSGLTQIIGLSQGLFRVAQDASGKIRLARQASADLMLDKSGKAVEERSLGLEWSDLRARIQRQLGPPQQGKPEQGK